MKLTVKSGLASLFLLMGLSLTACTPAAETQDPTATESMMETPSGESGEVDEAFINMMVPHHEGAVAMAQIASDHTQRSEIRIMADAIIATQNQEITQMKAWKEEWYGSSDTPALSEMPLMTGMGDMGDMGQTMNMQEDVDALRDAPEPFDLAFLDAMIPHHQSAIDAAGIVLQEAVHPEIRELAQGIIEAQQAEIDRMLEWRTAWFPDAPPLEY
jgi:uncharacterized protein (DUF305 family)